MSLRSLFGWLCMFFMLSGCSATKFLKEDESFYTGAEIVFKTQGKVGGKKRITKELEPMITPKPNGTILGSRPAVWLYFKAGNPEKKKGFRNFIKTKLGKPPVLLKDANPENTSKLLNSQLYNDGYFQAKVTPSVKTKNKKSEVTYTVLLYPPYRYREIVYPKGRDSVYASILQTLHEKSLLKVGARFDIETMAAEQERIEEVLENYGFYYFDDRYLIFEADTTVGNKQVDARLRLEKGIPDRAKRIFRINDVSIYPNYTLGGDTLMQASDTLLYKGYIFNGKVQGVRPRVLTRVINIAKGNIYTRTDHEYTLSHLMELGVYKFVNIKYDALGDSALLNTNIFLTPLKKKSLRAEVQAVSKSNNFVGPGISVTFSNRNFLGGAERFELKVNSAYEVQYSRKIKEPLNSFELGLESSLIIPRIIAPIKVDYASRKYIPSTQFRVGFNLQNRISFFRLNTFNAAYGYLWKESASKSHELYPVDISYVRTDKRSKAFDDLLIDNPFLANSFTDQFIVGTRYSYTLNTQLEQNPLEKYGKAKLQRSHFYFNGNIDVAGNALNAVHSGFKNSEGEYKIFGAPYSRYVKGDVDFRYYWQLDEHNKIASRIIAGVGHAFGDSASLPYIKQFSIGGSNSIRAFPARTIGPGEYNVRNDAQAVENSAFIDQRGDVKLEGNVEYRFDIIKSFKGALFVDAGNIWTLREDGRTGGKFKKNEFLEQIAVGTGLGFRFDFSFFVLRLDIAFPLRKPYIDEESDRWVIKDIDLGSSEWRKENLIFNIAIGYPF